jgi:hypothetical protein
MPEETAVQTPETKEIPLDQVTDMREYKKARTEGKSTVTQEVEKPAEEAKSESEEPKEEKPKHKGGWQARIDRLIKQQAALEAQLAEERKEKEELRSKANTAVPKTEQAQDGEPARENYDSDASYWRAVVRWEAKQELKAERESEAKQQQATEKAEADKAYNAKMIELQATNEEYVELMKQDIKVPVAIEFPVKYEMENGPEVAIYLAQHPELCEKMVAAPPSKAIAMAWDVSRKLAGEKISLDDEEPEEEAEEVEEKPEPKLKTKAPAPIKPISGGKTQSTVPLDKTDYQTYKKLVAQGRR